MIGRLCVGVVQRGVVVHLVLPPLCTALLSLESVQKQLKGVEILEGLTCSPKSNPMRGYFGFDLTLNGFGK